MRIITVFIALTIALFGATATIKRVDANATQAIVWYIAPDDSTCDVSVREGSSSTVAGALSLPIAISTDPSLFTNASNDNPANRTWVLRGANTRERKFIVGKSIGTPREYPLASDGYHKSGALPANTPHTALVTCPTGASPDATNTALKIFSTSKYQQGITTVKPWPYDSTQWSNIASPSFNVAPNSDGAAAIKFVHHETGAKFWPFSAAGAYRMEACTSPSLYCRPPIAYDPTATWTNLAGVVTGTGSATTHTGSGTQKLAILTTNMTHDGNQIFDMNARYVVEDILLKLLAQSSGSGSTLNVCLSIDPYNLNCSSQTKTVSIPTSQAYVQLPTDYPKAYLRSWLGGAFLDTIPQFRFRAQFGTATTSDTHTFAYTQGVYQSQTSAPIGIDTPIGTKVYIAGSGCNGLTTSTAAVNVAPTGATVADFCTISAVGLNNTFTVSETSANVTNATVTIYGAGFLVWVTGTSNTVTLAESAQTYISSEAALPQADGNAHYFSPETVTDNITGTTAYMVNVHTSGTTAGGPNLYIWVPSTHETRFLDKLWPPSLPSGVSANDTNDGIATCGAEGATFIRGSSGLQGVCLVRTNSGEYKLMKWAYDSSMGFAKHSAMTGYGDDNAAISWTNIAGSLPGVSNHGLMWQIQQLDSRFDPSTNYFQITYVGTSGDYAFLYGWHGQDLNGMMVSVNTSTGLVHSVLMTADYGQGLHTLYVVGGEGFLYWTGTSAGQNGSEAYASVVTAVNGSGAGTLTATPAINCPANLPAIAASFGISTGQQKCDLVKVAHQPCLAGASAAEKTQTTTCSYDSSKAAAWHPWTKGQFVTDTAVTNEIMMIVDTPVVGGGGDVTFTLARGMASSSNNANITCTSAARVHALGNDITQSAYGGCQSAGQYSLWDYANNTSSPNLYQVSGHTTIKWSGSASDTTSTRLQVAYTPQSIFGAQSMSGNYSTIPAATAPTVSTSYLPTFSRSGPFIPIQAHMSATNYLDTRLISADMHPMGGGGGGNAAYTYTQTTTAVTSVYKITGLTLSRYISMQPNIGRFQGREISGPTADMATAVDGDFCVIYFTGNTCGMSGPTVGDVYVKWSHYSSPVSGQCNLDNVSICPTWNTPTMGWAMAWDLSQSSGLALNGQRIATNPRQFQGLFENIRLDPTGRYAIVFNYWANGGGNNWYIYELPYPFATDDSINRSTWYKPAIGFSTAVAAATRASVEYGVMSYMASPSALQCLSPREACSTGDNGNGDDFAWASETQTYPLISAGLIRVPAPPQDILFYRRVYRAADGSVVMRGPIDVMITP